MVALLNVSELNQCPEQYLVINLKDDDKDMHFILFYYSSHWNSPKPHFGSGVVFHSFFHSYGIKEHE